MLHAPTLHMLMYLLNHNPPLPHMHKFLLLENYVLCDYCSYWTIGR